LNNMFPNRWIRRGGPINWPARSPHLTPINYFIWGYVKEIVYKTQQTTREDMKIRIINACTAISRETIALAINRSQQTTVMFYELEVDILNIKCKRHR
ncbi:hypothetical protein WH47_08396, partial [Habropoda laboriosa]